MTHAQAPQHSRRSWWRGATIWWLVLAMLAVAVFEKAAKPPLAPNSVPKRTFGTYCVGVMQA